MINPIILDGKKLSEKIKSQIQAEIKVLKEKHSFTPTLATILVGSDPSSQVYVKMKINSCEKLGMKSKLVELPETTTTEEWKMKTFNEDWYDGDTIISSIGQFGFLMTPLEALTMTALIANEGEIYTPHLVKKEDKQDENFKTKVNVEIKNEWYKIIKNGMRQVVASDIGTAKTLNMPFTKLAAKTGTAEFGKNKEYIHSWVVGFFPYDKPKYAFVFMMEKSKADKPDPATIVARDFLWWMWENKKEYFTE
jgi:penicillin-binding protein 2